MKKYTYIPFINSMKSCRRGLHLKLNKITGTVQQVKHVTKTAIKDPNGESLPHTESTEVLRSFRSIYSPHVGAKQLAKIARCLTSA
jgi:hypothetical protein